MGVNFTGRESIGEPSTYFTDQNWEQQTMHTTYHHAGHQSLRGEDPHRAPFGMINLDSVNLASNKPINTHQGYLFHMSYKRREVSEITTTRAGGIR